MPRRRAYSNHCGLAAALELVGDRWTMLVLRDLVLGPRRFAQLQAGLGSVAPDVLTQRLRSLTASGLVERAGTAYRLTSGGRGLVPAMRALAVWGGPHLPDTPAAGSLSAHGVLTSLVLAAAGSRGGVTRTIRFEIDDEVAIVTLSPQGNQPASGEADHAYTGTASELLALLCAQTTPRNDIERSLAGLLVPID